MSSISRYEQETIINFNEEEATAEVYTYNGKLRRRLEMLAEKYPAEVKLKTTCPTGAVTYTIPKNLITIRQPVSEERRQAMREQAISSNRRPPRRS